VTIEEITDGLTRVNGVRVVALCTSDGIGICSQAVEGAGDENRLAAMAAEIGRAVMILTQSWDGARYQTAAFEASSGKLVVSDVGKAFVAVVADQTANMGLLRLRIEQAATELRGEISRSQMPGGSIEPGETKPGGMPPAGASGSMSL